MAKPRNRMGGWIIIQGLFSRSFSPCPSDGTKSGFDCRKGASGIASARVRKGEAPNLNAPISMPAIIDIRKTWVSVRKKSTGPRYGFLVHFINPSPSRKEKRIQTMKLPSCPPQKAETR